MKPTPLPRHINLAGKSVTLKAENKARSEAQLMKLWKEEDSILETELQGLEGEHEIEHLDIWQTGAGFYLTLKFVAARNTYFLAVRRKRNGPRIFKDVNRLVDFLGTVMPHVEEAALHLLPIRERPKIVPEKKKPTKATKKTVTTKKAKRK